MSSTSKVLSGMKGFLGATRLANVTAGVPLLAVAAAMSALPKTLNENPPSSRLLHDDPPPPLELCDPVLAEHFKLVANGQHPTVKTVGQDGDVIFFRLHEIDPTTGKNRTLIRRMKPVKLPGRNEPCHCGSGKKFKKCCAV